MKFHKSRLQNLEEKRSLRQALFFFLLALILILIIFFIGLPLVIKFSVFLGNRQQASQYSEVSQLTLPVQPRLYPLSPATNSAIFNISGSAPAGLKVKVYLNDELLKEIIANNESEFNLSRVNLKEGKNIIKATSEVENKESEPSFATVIYKKTPPKLEINQPQKNAAFYDEEKEISVEGITDPQTKVTVNGHLAIVDEEGNFSLRLNLKEGENEIKVVAEDEAGNQSQTQLRVTYAP